MKYCNEKLHGGLQHLSQEDEEEEVKSFFKREGCCDIYIYFYFILRGFIYMCVMCIYILYL